VTTGVTTGITSAGTSADPSAIVPSVVGLTASDATGKLSQAAIGSS